MATGAYHFEMQITAIRPDAPVFRKSAPEASDALNEAVDAAREVLAAHGFQVIRTGYGKQRMPQIELAEGFVPLTVS